MSYFDINNLDKQIEESKVIKQESKLLKIRLKTFQKRNKIASKTRDITNHRENRKIKRFEKRQLKKIKKKQKLLKRGIVKGKETRKYQEYIHSELWEQRKKSYYRIHGRVCEKCKSYNHIDLHHAVYADFGKEKDAHLFALCRTHHKEFHKKHGVKGNMLKETLSFLGVA